MMRRSILIVLVMMLFSPKAFSQKIPLGEPVVITVLSYDTASLDYYNIYAVEYSKEDVKGNVEVLVPKNKDILVRVSSKEVKLCRVTEILQPSKDGKVLIPFKCQSWEAITLPNKKGEQTTLNLDPDFINPVVQLCE